MVEADWWPRFGIGGIVDGENGNVIDGGTERGEVAAGCGGSCGDGDGGTGGGSGGGCADDGSWMVPALSAVMARWGRGPVCVGSSTEGFHEVACGIDGSSADGNASLVERTPQDSKNNFARSWEFWRARNGVEARLGRTVLIRLVRMRPPHDSGEGGEDVFGVGADAVVGVGFGEQDLAGGREYEGGGEGETPGIVAVDEGDVDEDGAVVEANGFGDGVGDAEGVGEMGAGVGEDGKREVVVLHGEVVLAGKLGGDGDEQSSSLADGREGGLPGFELGHAVGTPAAAEEVNDERADRENVGGFDELATDGVREFEGRGGRADGEDVVFDAGGEEVANGAVGDGEALGLDESAGLGGDVVEFGLEISGVRHLY